MHTDRPISRLVSVLFLGLGLAGCGDGEIVAYRIPKEKDPSPSAADAHASAAANRSSSEAGGAGASANMSGTTVATAEGQRLTWAAPAHWQAKPGGAMRKGSYTIGDGEAQGELAITAFPGDVGGEVANVNRWRGQLQLPPLPATEIPSLITRLNENTLAMGVVDFANTATATPTRMIGAIVPFGRATWFFKLTGPDATVAAEKAVFLEFLGTVKPAAEVAAP